MPTVPICHGELMQIHAPWWQAPNLTEPSRAINLSSSWRLLRTTTVRSTAGCCCGIMLNKIAFGSAFTMLLLMSTASSTSSPPCSRLVKPTDVRGTEWPHAAVHEHDGVPHKNSQPSFTPSCTWHVFASSRSTVSRSAWAFGKLVKQCR